MNVLDLADVIKIFVAAVEYFQTDLSILLNETVQLSLVSIDLPYGAIKFLVRYLGYVAFFAVVIRFDSHHSFLVKQFYGKDTIMQVDVLFNLLR